MTKDIPTFQQYQREFTAYIRDPNNQCKPLGTVSRRMDVYKEIVFNNIFESVSACFPVAHKTLGKRRWLKLLHGFLRDHSANSPIFRKIPEEFISYIEKVSAINQAELPPYFISLCHYEWIELMVSTMDDNLISLELNYNFELDPFGDLLEKQVVFSPSMQLLNYEYAVQKISPRNKPTIQENTHLLVYRNIEFSVKFVELNSLAFRLLTLMQQDKVTGKQALTIISSELRSHPLEKILQFGCEVLEDLRSQGIILGTYNDSQ